MSNPSTQNTFLSAYETYNDAIFRYCFFETSNREVAVDLTQDTFTKVWQYLEDGKEVTHMKAFLYRVAGNLIIDYRRKKKSGSLDAMMEEGFDVAHNESGNPEEQYDAKKLLILLEEVGDKYRDVIIMKFIDELSIQEISKITGESENNISVRLHRGMEKLRELHESKNNTK